MLWVLLMIVSWHLPALVGVEGRLTPALHWRVTIAIVCSGTSCILVRCHPPSTTVGLLLLSLIAVLVLRRLGLGLSGWYLRLLAEDFLEGEGRRLREQLVNLKEQVAEVELAAPLSIVLATGPVGDEVAPDAVVLFDVVEQLDDGGVRGLVKVDIGGHDRILSRQQELEADRTHLVL